MCYFGNWPTHMFWTPDDHRSKTFPFMSFTTWQSPLFHLPSRRKTGSKICHIFSIFSFHYLSDEMLTQAPSFSSGSQIDQGSTWWAMPPLKVIFFQINQLTVCDTNCFYPKYFGTEWQQNINRCTTNPGFLSENIDKYYFINQYQ